MGCDAKGARFGGYIHMTVIQVLYVDWTIHLQCKVSNTSSNGFIVLNFFTNLEVEKAKVEGVENV